MTHFLRGFAALCLTFLLWVGAGLAQTDIDYDAWTKLATRAEDVIEAGRASDAALEQLRAEIATYRETFLSAQSTSSDRISTLQAQLDALGPVPEDGTEDAEIAARRTELTDQLARLRTPVQRAVEAYSRADGLIREIDTMIRSRQTDALLELGPSPLNPQRWAPALEELVGAMYSVLGEVTNAWKSDVKQAEMRSNLPLIITLVLFAIVLVLRGRRWIGRAVEYLRGKTRRGTGVWSFIVSLGMILLPLLGLVALTNAAEATGMFGTRGLILLQHVPALGAILLFIRWLADQSFHRDDEIATVHFEATRRIEARAYFSLFGVLLAMRGLLNALATTANFEPDLLAVMDFPILLVCALFLFRFGQLLTGIGRHHPEDAEPLSEVAQFRNGLARLAGRITMGVAVVGPVMSGIGYTNAGTAMVYPTVLSLCLAGVVLILQRFVNDLYRMATDKSVSEAASLLPVLAGFLLVLLALPVLALIWGARVADLTELWTRFQEGFQMGDTRISPSDFLTFAIVFSIGYFATRLLQKGLRTSVLPRTRIDVGGQNAITSGVGYLGIFLAALVAITSAGLDLSNLAIVAGALSVGIGFGLQNIVSNFVSGIILLIERPIGEGDWIEVGGQHGIVRDISVRSTRIETFDKFDVIVPNADLVSGQVRNYTRGNLLGRIIVEVGVAYGTDTRKVEKILLDIARRHDAVMLNPAPGVDFMGFGADSLDFRVRAVLHDINQGLAVRTEMRHQIVEAFAREGIEIPFAQRDVWIRNPEALVGKQAPVPEPRPEPQKDEDNA
ncbi:DUF3772 domain-containing protein [Mesobacterium sp. TK19101]|uniref:DUF3772 domain-containing protein n=1 Tax=Mesobacterium hydrothermale TaxID=3111907 RepID=A0ABU6HMA3_9RHOB|nr:DUF3772 domain-containing protein [Mesobacterium sp. TK19101]MEC3863232.1 DUF3772 domain-containing protein [Mesobacterium sp. TK19101]